MMKTIFPLQHLFVEITHVSKNELSKNPAKLLYLSFYSSFSLGFTLSPSYSLQLPFFSFWIGPFFSFFSFVSDINGA